MGALFTKLFSRFDREVRILLLGLDAAGKTTILYRMKLAESVSTTPTVGFNVETVQYKNLTMTLWDVGGQHKIRRLWEFYYQGSDALVFVVDSQDSSRFEEAKDALQSILQNEMMKDTKVLVLANKMDMPNAASASELTEALGLKSVRQTWFIQSSNALTGDGLFEGFDWLSEQIQSKK